MVAQLNINEIIFHKLDDYGNTFRGRARDSFVDAKGRGFVDPQKKLKALAGCSFAKGLGIKVNRDSTETGIFTASMDVKNELHENPNGKCHGGAITGLIDVALAGAAETVRQSEDEKVVTSNFTTHFLNSAEEGDKLTAVAIAEKVGSNIVNVAVRVFKNLYPFCRGRNKEKSLVATAVGDCIRIKAKATEKPVSTSS